MITKASLGNLGRRRRPPLSPKTAPSHCNVPGVCRPSPTSNVHDHSVARLYAQPGHLSHASWCTPRLQDNLLSWTDRYTIIDYALLLQRVGQFAGKHVCKKIHTAAGRITHHQTHWTFASRLRSAHTACHCREQACAHDNDGRNRTTAPGGARSAKCMKWLCVHHCGTFTPAD